MIDSQKSESPAATGLHADQPKTNTGEIFHPMTGPVNPSGHTFDEVEVRELRSRFARRGYTMQRVYRADDGRVTFHIMRNASCCVLSHPHDVRAYLAQVEGAPV